MASLYLYIVHITNTYITYKYRFVVFVCIHGFVTWWCVYEMKWCIYIYIYIYIYVWMGYGYNREVHMWWYMIFDMLEHEVREYWGTPCICMTVWNSYDGERDSDRSSIVIPGERGGEYLGNDRHEDRGSSCSPPPPPPPSLSLVLLLRPCSCLGRCACGSCVSVRFWWTRRLGKYPRLPLVLVWFSLTFQQLHCIWLCTILLHYVLPLSTEKYFVA